MKLGVQIGAVIVALLALAAAALGVVQNSARTTELTFDLGFGAWGLQEPVRLVYLLGGALALGFALGLLVLLPRALRLGTGARDRERRQILGDDDPSF